MSLHRLEPRHTDFVKLNVLRLLVGAPAPQAAGESGQRVAEFDILWFEEPLFPELLDAPAELKRRVSVAIAAGERVYTRFAAREFVEERCGDFIQPDISRVGIKDRTASVAGRRWRASASARTTPPARHQRGDAPLETTETDVPWRRGFSDEDVRIVDSEMLIPTKPGLGIELNEQALTKHPPKQAEHEALIHFTGIMNCPNSFLAGFYVAP